MIAQTLNTKKLDNLFSRIEAKEKGMGTVSIFKDGKEVYTRSIGFANVEDKVKAQADTRYRIGSITKTFTATLIMQLNETGQLDLQTTLSDFFPELPNAKKITIKQLLGHRSGLYNFTNAEDYLDWDTESKSQEDLIKLIIKNGTVFEPGEKGEYSNTNYVLLTWIAEKVSGKKFEDLLHEKITKPLGLKHTKYGGTIEDKNNNAHSYTNFKDWERSEITDMSIPLGAGAIASTAKDINTFFHALFNEKIISKSSLEQMMTIEEGYGLGLFKFPFNGKYAYGHTGGIDAFQSNAGYFPEENMVFTYLSNGVVAPMNDIAIGILSIYFGNDYEIPEFPDAYPVTSEELDAYLGTYSTPSFPLKIMITKKENILIAQATGQASFNLVAYDKHKFSFDGAGIKMEFVPEENKLNFSQGVGKFSMTKE